MQITLTPDQAQALRTIGAKINGSIGGSAKSKKQRVASALNVRKAIRARKRNTRIRKQQLAAAV